MRKWFKSKLLVMLLPVLAALMVLPFWWAGSTAYAATESIASGTVPWNNANGDGASTPFQMAAISSVFSGTLACPNMIQSVPPHGTPTLRIWLIEDSHGGRLDASGETHCTQTPTPWSLSAGQNPAGHYHLWVNCHWGGCGHDVTVSYIVDTKPVAPVVTKPVAPVVTKPAAPAGNTLTADQLHQTLNNQTPKLGQAWAVHTGWATSASPGTGSFPSSTIQSKIAADALITCNNPTGTLRMSLKISPNSSLNPNKVLNSTNLSCQSGSGHTDDLSVHTDRGFIVTFDNAINTGNWAVKYVASADKPLPTPPSPPSCTNNCNPVSCTSNCTTNPPPCSTSTCKTNPPPCSTSTCNGRTVPTSAYDACVAGMKYVWSVTPTDPGPSCDTKNANSTTYNACEWGYLGGDPAAYGPAKPYADKFCAGYHPTPPKIQDTAAYGYCQAGVYALQYAHEKAADCSQSSSLDSKIACDYGYWYDNYELTFDHGSIIVKGDQQKADQACNSIYHS
ncbi:hypothetical protein KSF_054430 [Reticulibacter mediterranei]|uniref:Uncharacterized protein n=1 Tax=Reticulibacter mediterranei TaxID=2778369 RepID=A0A8J3N4J2_9CHLR|nr:hypothetical protein [Reticulibacter mediterranei]GHO95395.1 hypothetical protein KSF_054430 [Reticulibacter mediterranei]